MSRVFAVILCGGTGSRLWPLSRALLPKQFLPLVSEHTMLQETALRLRGLDEIAGVVLVSNDEHRFLVADQMRGIGVVPRLHLLEPAGRNTAPAVAAAALALGEEARDAVLLVLPSDSLIEGVDRFHAAVREAVALAERGKLVTFGIEPDAPATGYGYIRRGAPAPTGPSSFLVAEFVEKPDANRALDFVASGEYYWNSGMFVFRAERYLDELRAFRPDIARAVERAVTKSRSDLDFVRLDAQEFGACPSDSLDYAVMERTREACVVAARFRWSDVGSWSALWEVGEKDARGNIARGDTYADRTENCYLRAESRLLAAVGVKDLVIVETDDAVLVAHKDAAQDVKQTVEHLRASNRPEHFSHSRVYRPWGYYESIDAGERYQVKRLMIKPGAKISLQRHRSRAEHWVVVAGRARVTRDEDLIHLGPNQSTYIPQGTRHRLENIGEGPLFVIEVQSGDYLGEDDIERFADDYKRI